MGAAVCGEAKVQCEGPHYGALGGLGAHPKTVLIIVDSVHLLTLETKLSEAYPTQG